MENHLSKQFSFNYKEVLIDEIALEGLEGIGFDLLWRRVEKRMSSPITEKMKARFWEFILYCDGITLYELPEPLKYVEIKDRFDIIDEETGNITDPPDYLDGLYEFCPSPTDYGSSIYHKTRKKIAKVSLKDIPYGNVESMFKDKLVMVASKEERWKALAPQMPMTSLKELTPTHYCLLELIGRARENGQMTIGKTNLTKVIKDPKLLFYNRKHLHSLDLIRVLPVPLHLPTVNKSVKALLLRLKRFHQPLLSSMPKRGKLHDIIEHLKQQPNYTDACKNMINLGLFTQARCRKLFKSENSYAFAFENIDSCNKKIKTMVDKNVRLDPASEESSQSDEETSEEPLKCQYQIKVNLLRQAYERLLAAGLEGCSQVELGELLGIEYYTARTICRIFKKTNLVKEIFVDRGKQRTARFVASASGGAVDAKYEAEKKKFIDNLNESKNAVAQVQSKPNSQTLDTSNESDSDVPKKKPKLTEESKFNDDIVDITPDAGTLQRSVTEIKYLGGLQKVEQQPFISSKKNPTMRQLKYANGILKTIKENHVISGYATLNALAAKESNEPLMDNKCFKNIVQKLISEGQIKLLKLTTPIWQQSCLLLCAPQVQVTDPKVKAKYKEMSLKLLRSKKEEMRRQTQKKKDEKQIKAQKDMLTRPLSMASYPRYLKLQKLHEILIKHVYFNDNDEHNVSSEPGFCSLVDIIPEFTVEFVLGNMCHTALMSMMYSVKSYNLNNLLQRKLSQVPQELFKTFIATPALQNSWRCHLKALSSFGLIQLVKKVADNEDTYTLTYEFFVNRHATILDTTGDWPREDADKEKLKKSYYFESMKNVEEYWNNVYEISINTNIKLETKDRFRKIPVFIPRLREHVQENDDGQFYGNGLGPCGFDASFYMDMQRFWVIKVQPNNLIKKPVIKVPPKRRTFKKPKAVAREKRVRKPPEIPKKRNYSKLKRQKWNANEDKLLMLCKAAITVISPVAHSGCLRLRNLVAKDILSQIDPKKVASVCHRRCHFIESDANLAYQKDCLINELRRHPQILRRYEGLFKTLRIQYCGNLTKVINMARLPMMELVWTMMQMLNNETLNKKTPCVADNLEDFHNKFTICPSTVNRNFNSYKTPLESDPSVAAIKEAIVVAVMASFRTNQSPDIGKLIHSMLNVYTEQELRAAVEQLRKCGAVATNKHFVTALNTFHFQDTAQSCYKISTNYQRKWICRMNSDFVSDLMFALDEDIPNRGLKGKPEINCIMFESLSSDIVDIVCVNVPVVTDAYGAVDVLQEDHFNVTDMIMNYKIKAGTVGWNAKKHFKKFSDIHQEITFEEAIDALIKESELHEPPKIMKNEDKIILHLAEKKKKGSTFDELQDVTGYNTDILTTKLKTMESQNIVKRVGYFENLIVLTKFAKPWTVRVQDKLIIPTPWLTLQMDIRKDIFFKWAGVIVNKVFTKPGCSIDYLMNDSEMISCRAVQDISMVLEKWKCVILKCIRTAEPDLFSEDTTHDLEDFNPYASIENILVFPVKDLLTRFACIRKKVFDHE